MASPSTGTGKKPCSCKSSSRNHNDGSSDDDNYLDEYVSNWGPELCVVEATKADYKTCTTKHAIANRVWAAARPPRGFSTPVPTVSARRVQVVQAQLIGTTEEIKGTLPVVPNARDSSVFKSDVSMSSKSMQSKSLSSKSMPPQSMPPQSMPSQSVPPYNFNYKGMPRI